MAQWGLDVSVVVLESPVLCVVGPLPPASFCCFDAREVLQIHSSRPHRSMRSTAVSRSSESMGCSCCVGLSVEPSRFLGAFGQPPGGVWFMAGTVRYI